MRRITIFIILLSIIYFNAIGQNSSCQLGHCNVCKIKMTEGSYYEHLVNSSNTMMTIYCPHSNEIKAKFLPLGEYSQPCLSELKKREEQQKIRDREFEAKKEKFKSGETVVEWHSNGKARMTMKNTSDPYNNITWYNYDGIITQKFVNNVFVLYQNGQLYWQGPGIAELPEGSSIVQYYVHGFWPIDDKKYKIFLRDKDVTKEFNDALTNAKSAGDIDNIKRAYPFSDLNQMIDKRLKEILSANINKEKYDRMYKQAMDEFSYVGFKKFNEAYPDSAVGFTKGLMKLLEPGSSSDTLVFIFYNSDLSKLHVIDRILFDKINDKKYCQTNDNEKLLINCFLSPNIRWLSSSCKYSSEEIYKAEIDIFRENGVIKKALIFSDVKAAVGKVTYNDNLTSVMFRSFDCSQESMIVYYKGGKEYFRIYDNKDKVVYKDVNTNEEKAYQYVHYYGQSLYGNEKKSIAEFYNEAGPEVFNEFFNNFFRDGKSNLKKRTGFEELKFISSDIDFFYFLISTQFQQSPFNFHQSQFYSDRAIEYIKNYESSALTIQALWSFEILKSFSYWMSNQPDKAVEMIRARCNESYTEPGRKTYNGTGSPSYTADIKLKYMDEVRRIYKIFEDAGIVFPEQKETWKKIKSLK